MKERRSTVRNMSERREYTRFTIDQMVEISFGREQFVHAAGLNLSEKGVLCRTSEFVEPYARVFLMLQLPVGDKTKQVKCEGVVVRCNKTGEEYDTAISFSELSEADRKSIEDYSRTKV